MGSLCGKDRNVDLTRCYTCGKKLGERFVDGVVSLSFYGRAADHAGFPRCMVNFCHDCGIAARKKYFASVDATKAETMAAGWEFAGKHPVPKGDDDDDDEEEESEGDE